MCQSWENFSPQAYSNAYISLICPWYKSRESRMYRTPGKGKSLVLLFHLNCFLSTPGLDLLGFAVITRSMKLRLEGWCGTLEYVFNSLLTQTVEFIKTTYRWWAGTNKMAKTQKPVSKGSHLQLDTGDVFWTQYQRISYETKWVKPWIYNNSCQGWEGMT